MSREMVETRRVLRIVVRVTGASDNNSTMRTIVSDFNTMVSSIIAINAAIRIVKKMSGYISKMTSTAAVDRLLTDFFPVGVETN